MDANYKEYTDFITNVSQFDEVHKSTLNKPLHINLSITETNF